MVGPSQVCSLIPERFGESHFETSYSSRLRGIAAEWPKS